MREVLSMFLVGPTADQLLNIKLSYSTWQTNGEIFSTICFPSIHRCLRNLTRKGY